MLCSLKYKSLTISVGFLLSGLFLFESSAYAGGYLTARYGGELGHVALGNAFAVYFNPAAMGDTRGTQITLDAALGARFATYTRSNDALSAQSTASLNDSLYRQSNTGEAKLANFVPLPFLGMVTDLGTSSFRLGFASYIPFGGTARWSKNLAFDGNNDSPGAVDGPQRWHLISGTLFSVYNTLALAYRIEPARLTFGASVSGIINKVDFLQAKNSNGGDDIRTSDGSLLEGRAILKASGFNVGISIGAHWEPLENKKLRLGISYSSQPGFGTMRLRGTLRHQFGNDPDPALTTSIDFLQSLPDIVYVGAALNVTFRVQLRLDGQLERWSVLKNQCVVVEKNDCNVDPNTGRGEAMLNIPRNWKDSFGLRLGTSYFIEPETQIFAGTGFGTSPVPKSTIDAGTLDGFRMYANIGIRHAFNKHLALGASYNHMFISSVSTDGTSIYSSLNSPSRSPSANGKYSSTIFFLNTNLTYTF